jgi:hypothetical protein
MQSELLLFQGCRLLLEVTLQLKLVGGQHVELANEGAMAYSWMVVPLSVTFVDFLSHEGRLTLAAA